MVDFLYDSTGSNKAMVGNYQIFVVHISEDEGLARFIYESLDNIVEFHPYLAQDYSDPGENFKERIQNSIYQSRFFIVILSEKALSNQWVNQELGYACAIKRQKPRNYNIIPLSQSNLNLKGFITKDTEDIIFYDKYNDNNLIGMLIYTIRSKIYNGLTHRNLRFKVRCDFCFNRVNLPNIYEVYLPDQQVLNESVKEGHDVWYSDCPSCQNRNFSNIYTWAQVKNPK